MFCSADFDMDFAKLSVPKSYIMNIKRAKSSVPCDICLGKLPERAGSQGVTGVKFLGAGKPCWHLKCISLDGVWKRPLSRSRPSFRKSSLFKRVFELKAFDKRGNQEAEEQGP